MERCDVCSLCWWAGIDEIEWRSSVVEVDVVVVIVLEIIYRLFLIGSINLNSDLNRHAAVALENVAARRAPCTILTGKTRTRLI